MAEDAASTRDGCAEASEGRPDSFELLLRRIARLCDSDIDRIAVPSNGEIVDRKYRIDAQLAFGGMGAVLRATHIVSGKVVALKWLLPTADRAAARFLREVRAAARVDHPNVVDVYDLGTHRGGHYLVMELLHGRSLGARMRAGRLEPAELVAIMIPILRGLAAAHARGVIHRDLKPDNVFLCEGPDGDPRAPKVLDFGISKLRDSGEETEPLTSSGTGIGTPAYMAPEQLVDARSVDERADIYAAGVIMYEALAGRLPAPKERHETLAAALAPRAPLPLRMLQPSVPVSLERIVHKAMATMPDDRYDSAEAVARDLSLVLTTPDVATREPQRRRSWRGQLAACARVAALTALATLHSQTAREATVTTLGASRVARAAHLAALPQQEAAAAERGPLHTHAPVRATGARLARAERLYQALTPSMSLASGSNDATSLASSGERSERQESQQTRRKTPRSSSQSNVMPRAGKIYLKEL